MMSQFDNFIETSLEHVPPEFERNFSLIRELDQRADELIPKLNELIDQYRLTRRKEKRKLIKREINTLTTKILSYADDKIELAAQTYELVDKNITLLSNMAIPQEIKGEAVVPPGCDMPVDQNEPKFCFCRGISHGEMIACDDERCLIEWFHLGCVGLVAPPSGKWYCHQCRPNRGTPKARAKSKSRSKRSK